MTAEMWKPHKTMAQKKCGKRYEDCIRKYSCPDGEECWYDSEVKLHRKLCGVKR